MDVNLGKKRKQESNEGLPHKTDTVGPAVRMQLLQMGSAYLLSRALHVAADLGIADYLANGKNSLLELAQAIGCNENALYRLLRMLASHGIFAEDEIEKRRFTLTPLAETLRSDVTGSLRNAIRMIDDETWNAYGQLAFSIKTGSPAFEAVTGSQYFEYQERHQDVNDRFAKGIANFGDHEDRLIATAYDFSAFRCVVEIGGGQGGLISEVLKTHPTIRGILYDRPDVIKQTAGLMTAGVTNRCEYIGGDFLDQFHPTAMSI